MNGTCFQDPIGFIKFSISPEFVPLLMDKDLLHKFCVSLRGMKPELYAKCFQVHEIRENLPPHVDNAHRKPQTWRERLVLRFAVNSDLKLSNGHEKSPETTPEIWHSEAGFVWRKPTGDRGSSNWSTKFKASVHTLRFVAGNFPTFF